MMKRQDFLRVRPCNVVLVAFFTATVAACTAPTPYGPAQANRGYGYSEEQIETNRFRVTFAGNSSTPRNVVENYLLVRAAELTKSRGFDYFVLAKQDVEPTTRYWSSFDNFAGYGYYYHSWPYYGAGMDYGTSYPITRYTAYADILMVRGPKDAEDVRSFSADDVMAKLGPSVQRPQAQ
jgi:hypothetical protein